MNHKDKRFFDFMCSCGEENAERCEEVYEEVRAAIGEPSDKDFLTYLVHALDDMDNGMANIEHIHTDMWSGVAMQYQHSYSDGEWKVQFFWIECDRIHHGLARGYQLVDAFDKGVAK